ncbi:hypothetical protein RHODGE_RHODGE_03978 [Rhodoplanes serenus]|uniref:Uncharacterized protein n=1 Tax=Rhodoplanes serenus TaxID=200615 RepID=A0A3S4DHV5_9BRAD|nr:hypothetical protein [Rhodoplanes serenus]VCU10774.1 hypothetical protein RHODGE_RHODGE_03978 [Rhodoplanes serenus]
MGIFDIFTGSSAKNAAEQNARLYAQYGRDAQGYIDQGGAAADAAYGKAAEAFTPLGQIGDRYSRAGALAMDAMGVNGADAAAAARTAFQSSPGYQYQVDQAADAVARKAASLGLAASGNTMAEIGARAQQLANQDWNNWLGHLKGYSDSGLSATGAAASGRAGVYGTQAGAYDNRALNRSNVAGNVASGTANSNTASANAQMNASGQFWNGLMNMAGNLFGGKK